MKFLGVNIAQSSSISQEEAMDAVARLFLSDISVAKVQRIVDVMNKTMYIKVKELTKPYIQSLRSNYTNKSLVKRFKTRSEDWEKTFGKINKEDFDFITDRYQIKYRDIFGCQPFMSPKEMADYLKNYVKGQDSAIEQLSVPFFQHYAKLLYGFRCPTTKPLLLCGPTGCGKTEILNLFSEMCNCPFIVVNTSECSATGWKGFSIGDVIAQQIRKYTKEKLRHAILFIDEIDKVTHRGCNNRNMDDLGFDITRDLMNLCDPRNPIRISNGLGNNAEQNFIELPVDNLLIVFAGAFTGIDSIIKKRLNLSTRIGFARNDNSDDGQQKVLPFITVEDLKEWGFIAEFTGRLGQIITLNPLDEDVMYEILTESKNSILSQQITYTWNLYHTNLKFTEAALRLICKQAVGYGLGFRGVQTVLSSCLNDIYFKLPVAGETCRTIDVDEFYIAKQLKIK